jgi:hypothetical protein
VSRYHSKHSRPSWLSVPTKTWYVEVRLPSTSPGNAPVVYALGPLGRWSRAREVAEQWERRHGPLTTAVHEKLSHLRAGLARRGESVSAAEPSRT